jgi:hypothetical protein
VRYVLETLVDGGMPAQGVLRFTEYGVSDGWWPPSLAPILVPIIIPTMIGSQVQECKDLDAVDSSISSHSGGRASNVENLKKKTSGVKTPEVEAKFMSEPRLRPPKNPHFSA